MAIVIASDLGKDIAGEPLLRGISFKLERRDRMTLSGRNGSGKTTLLRMLAGEAAVDAGELVIGRGVKVALHDQRPPRERQLTLRGYVLSGAAELLALEQRLGELEQAMAAGAHDQATLSRYAEAQAALESAGGYTWRERALVTLHGLGFHDERDLDRPLSSFSGGELTRASLGRALAGQPDLLLLDEPTNHLDIESLEWLEQHLAGLDAAVVLVAHDRWFLEAVGTSVLELEAGRGRYFAGPWHAWRREKASRELAMGRAIERQREEIERLERFVTRFRAGTRARQAQSRAKRLEKIERIERGPREGATLEFAFKPPARSGRVVFELEGARVRVGERILVEGAELWLERGEHVSLVGPNGAGKTTLIETLAGRRALGEQASPDGPVVEGRLRAGHNVSIGFLSQHAEELGGGTARTVLEACQHATGLTPGQARALLGRFLFSGEEAEKPLDGLSGGERRRLSLAILVQSGANVLILDEPTNHLDLESREALEQALAEFPGSLLLVSHDRALLDAVGTRTVAFEEETGEHDAGAATRTTALRPRTMRSYAGGWHEYLRLREAREARAAQRAAGERSATKRRAGAATASGAGGGPAKASGAGGGPAKASGAGGGPAKASGARGRPPRASRRRADDAAELVLERQIEEGEAALRQVEDELSEPGAWSTPARIARSSARHREAKAAVERLYEQLEQIAG